MSALKPLDFYEENDLYRDHSSEIDLGKLANLLEISQKDLASALGIKPSNLSKVKSSNNDHLKQWMVVFNKIIEQIDKTEPEISRERKRQKMSRWLKMPNNHFPSGQTPLEMMMQGKTRNVINLLEQLSS